jgi:hypothetical protein
MNERFFAFSDCRPSVERKAKATIAKLLAVGLQCAAALKGSAIDQRSFAV